MVEPTGRAGAGHLQVVLPFSILVQLRMHAEGSYPEECWGLLIGVREGASVHVRQGLRCAGAAPGGELPGAGPLRPRALLNAMRSLRHREEEVVGFYHSDPDPDAPYSGTDIAFAGLGSDTVWLVVPVDEDGAREERAWWLPPHTSGGGAPFELPLRTSATDSSWS